MHHEQISVARNSWTHSVYSICVESRDYPQGHVDTLIQSVKGGGTKLNRPFLAGWLMKKGVKTTIEQEKHGTKARQTDFYVGQTTNPSQAPDHKRIVNSY